MNIYVSSLSYDVSSEDLKAVFEAFGEVNSANVIIDKFTQRSRGFGFVEMPNQEQAENAIKDLNGTQMEGRTINVAEAKERPARTEGFNRSSSFKKDRNTNRW
jgi:RNA recognition motif-containing protein